MRLAALIPYRHWFASPAPVAYFGESRMSKLGWRVWLHKQRHLPRLQLQAVAAVGLARSRSNCIPGSNENTANVGHDVDRQLTTLQITERSGRRSIRRARRGKTARQLAHDPNDLAYGVTIFHFRKVVLMDVRDHAALSNVKHRK
jgi:hypothetical protein